MNNKIRDYDIILEKLQGHGYDSESALVLTLTREKLVRVLKAIKYAKKVI